MTMMVHDQSSDPQSSSSSSSSSSPALNKRKGGETKPDSGKPLKKSKHCRASKAKWTPEEDEILTRAVMMSGEGNWKKIAQSLNDRSHLQCLHRWQKVLNPALVKGPWKEEEDAKLSELVEKYGPKDWSTIAAHIPGRIGKQCRERWFNHLSPDVRKTNWTPEEDRIIIDAHSKIGNKWTNISKLLEGRPANAIKNHWNSTLLKRIQDSAGEPTPRRDRNRNKKPPPLRATEFDFRMQLQNQQQFEDSSDTSPPQQYHHSPVSSPETTYPEPQSMANTVRFQHYPPEVVSHVFFNPFNDHNSNAVVNGLINNINHHHIANINVASAWDSWPAPNIIHLNPSPPHTPSASAPSSSTHASPSNAIVASSVPPTPSGMMSPPISIGANLHPHQTINSCFNNTPFSQNVMNVLDAYNSEFGLGITEPSQEYFMELYNNTPQNNPLPVELQYCFEHPQQAEQQQQPHENACGYAPLSVDSSGMNVNPGMNVNMGMLNMDIGAGFPLDL